MSGIKDENYQNIIIKFMHGIVFLLVTRLITLINYINITLIMTTSCPYKMYQMKPILQYNIVVISTKK